jgi:hypothetical protein
MNVRLAAVLWAGAMMTASAADVTLQDGPTIRRDGNRTHIRFAVSAPTDVEVAILNKRGDVVRHLAAGVLGAAKAPPAPLEPGLRQELEWDGTDDLGNRAAGGPFRVRVRAGMGVRFGRLIGGDPTVGTMVGTPYRAPVNGVAVGPDGDLYLKMMSAIGSHGNTGLWPWQLRHFKPDGTYVKTLLPYPPSTDRDRAGGFRLLDTGDGHFTPALRTSLYPTFYVFGDEICNRLVDGSVVFIDSMRRRITFFKVDGSNATKTMPMWSPKAKLKCPAWLSIQVAFSPDGKTLYYSNVAGTAYDGKKPSDIDARWPQGRIYRQDLTKPGTDPQPFYDLELPDWDKKKYWMPSAWDKKTAAAGICCDAEGNVLVGDLVNQEVVEISPAGKKLSATPVPWPDKVMVSRKTGTLYVLSKKVSRGFLPPGKLRKITGRGADARVVASLPFKGRTMGGAYALDESGETPVLWLGGDGRLMRVEDRGGEFVVTRDDFINRDPDAIAFAGYMDVDPEADLVYVTQKGVFRYDGRTGKGGRLKIKAVDLAVGPNGMVYTWGTSGGYRGPVARYTRELKPAPLAATGTHTYGSLYGRAGRGSAVCGMAVDARGRVYATWGSNRCHVRVYGTDGELVEYPRTVTEGKGKQQREIPAAITGVSGYGGSIRVDLGGNIYLVQQGLPKKFKRPPGFAKDTGYGRAVGTVLKFGPAGGEPLKGKAAVFGFDGVLATYADCGPISRWAAAGACACTKPRFDVDRFGRLFIPNGVTFSVSVRDNAGNEIVRFGHYGNFDAQGPESPEPKPDIPLGWPTCVGASDRFIYVGDTLNHRVVRVDKTWAAEAVADVK